MTGYASAGILGDLRGICSTSRVVPISYYNSVAGARAGIIPTTVFVNGTAGGSYVSSNGEWCAPANFLPAHVAMFVCQGGVRCCCLPSASKPASTFSQTPSSLLLEYAGRSYSP